MQGYPILKAVDLVSTAFILLVQAKQEIPKIGDFQSSWVPEEGQSVALLVF